MREILFRGKRSDNGNWITGSFHKRLDDYFIIPLPIVTSQSKVVPETVGQFTGLTDKNGTKIFEGDIVDILPEVDEIGVIEWADDEAMFALNADGWYANFDNYLPEDVEVIGNIYDNPELLGGAVNV